MTRSKVYERNKKVTIYGNGKEVQAAEKVLDGLDIPPQEGKARLVIQQAVDARKLKASISYDGNNVWSYDRLIRDFEQFIKDPRDKDAWVPLGSMLRLPVSGGKCPMTDYLYRFLSLDTGSIAHYDKHGWHAIYPDVDALRAYFKQNEFGQRVVDHIPGWHTDAIRIAKKMESLLKSKPQIEVLQLTRK